jgi:peroxiredoxin
MDVGSADWTVLASRVALASVLAIAAAAKLIDRRGFRTALAEFGVPAGLAAVALPAVVLAEGAIALALVPAATARAGALAAVALIALFTGAIVLALRRGRRPACHCFGAIGAGPIGWRTVARNTALLVLALAIVAVGPGPGLGEAVGDLGATGRVALAAGLVLAAVVAGFTWLTLTLLRREGRLLLRLDALEGGATAGRAPGGLPVDALAPPFTLRDADDAEVSLAELLTRGRPVLLVFSDTRCVACEALLPRLGMWQREHAGVVELVLLVGGDGADAARTRRDAHGLGTVLRSPDASSGYQSVAQRYQLQGTPSAVLVGTDGRIAGPTAAGEDEIAALIGSAAGTIAGPVPGDVAPAIAGSDPAGERVSLDPEDGPVLVAFWDLDCPACGDALEDLRRWETSLTGVRLVVVSRGDARRNRALGLSAPVIVDDGDALTRAFGVRGTPSAVVIDASGVIAAPVAEGLGAMRVLAALAPQVRPVEVT